MHAEPDVSSKNMRIKRNKMNSAADESAVAHLLGIETAVLHDEFDDHSDDGHGSEVHSDGEGASDRSDSGPTHTSWYGQDGGDVQHGDGHGFVGQ